MAMLPGEYDACIAANGLATRKRSVEFLKVNTQNVMGTHNPMPFMFSRNYVYIISHLDFSAGFA